MLHAFKLWADPFMTLHKASLPPHVRAATKNCSLRSPVFPPWRVARQPCD
jgi:hypothetical protein